MTQSLKGNVNVDPITLEVFRHAVTSISDEMTASLVRTAYSTNIKDRRDCSCALYSAKGELVAQTNIAGAPSHLGTMKFATKRILQEFPVECMKPDDAFIYNTPYPVGPGHLSDITIVSPIYFDEQVIGFATSQAHHVDVGGAEPGSMPFGVTEIYQEGLQIPPVHLLNQGELNKEVLDLIKENIRVKRDSEGDIWAQIAANNKAKKRMVELAEKWGLNLVEQSIGALMDYSEKRMRAGISQIPDGEYSFEDYLEGDGITEDIITIRAMVKVNGDEIEIDFTGTDDQTAGPLNSRRPITLACVYYVIKALVDPELPANEGAYRPINVITREGSLLESKYPAPVCNSNIVTDQRVVDVLLGALKEAIPEKVMAACSGTMNIFNIGGLNPTTGEYFNYVETYGGGQGAMHELDGMNAVHTHMTNTRNAPVEALENTYPFLINEYSLVENSEGPGKFRGGLGLRRSITLLTNDFRVTLGTDRRKIKPWGVDGGQGAATSTCILLYPNGEKESLPTKFSRRLEGKGITFITETPGGGGWGNPLERDPNLVLRDVQLGYISKKRAKHEYGVVFKPGTLEIDHEETSRIRKREGRE